MFLFSQPADLHFIEVYISYIKPSHITQGPNFRRGSNFTRNRQQIHSNFPESNISSNSVIKPFKIIVFTSCSFKVQQERKNKTADILLIKGELKRNLTVQRSSNLYQPLNCLLIIRYLLNIPQYRVFCPLIACISNFVPRLPKLHGVKFILN